MSLKVGELRSSLESRKENEEKWTESTDLWDLIKLTAYAKWKSKQRREKDRRNIWKINGLHQIWWKMWIYKCKKLWINSKRFTPRHIIIKPSKPERGLKVTHHIQEILNKINSQFLIRNHGCQRVDNILKVWKEKTCQTRILYLAKLSFKTEGE